MSHDPLPLLDKLYFHTVGEGFDETRERLVDYAFEERVVSLWAWGWAKLQEYGYVQLQRITDPDTGEVFDMVAFTEGGWKHAKLRNLTDTMKGVIEQQRIEVVAEEAKTAYADNPIWGLL